MMQINYLGDQNRIFCHSFDDMENALVLKAINSSGFYNWMPADNTILLLMDFQPQPASKPVSQSGDCHKRTTQVVNSRDNNNDS